MLQHCHPLKGYLPLLNSTIPQRHGTSFCGILLSHKDTVSVPVVLYCQTKTRHLSLWCSTVTQRHGICSCGALLSHKDTVSVSGVLNCHTKTRFQCLRCSAVAQRHGSSPCPCDALLPHEGTRRRKSCPHGTLSPIAPIPVPWGTILVR